MRFLRYMYGVISDKPPYNYGRWKTKIIHYYDFASYQIQGHLNLRKHEHSDFDPYVEKLTSGSSTEIISPFGKINVVAVI